jgi:hypothetical protein
MSENVQYIVREAILRLINETTTDANIAKSIRLHERKIHFVPARYRVLGGLLQSLNIKFGNFIEKLIALVVEKDSMVETHPLSGKKVPLSMHEATDALIDTYITHRQLSNSPDQCDGVFAELLMQIVKLENQSGEEKQTIRHDIDTLFKTKSGKFVFLEIKYNDDHDTGKFVDINRKLIKTFAGLVNHLNITDPSQLIPILYYFNETKRWGPIYIPSSNIFRGAQLFNLYFETKYSDIDLHLRNLGEDPEVIAIFDALYKKIRFTKYD